MVSHPQETEVQTRIQSTKPKHQTKAPNKACLKWNFGDPCPSTSDKQGSGRRHRKRYLLCSGKTANCALQNPSSREWSVEDTQRLKLELRVRK